MQVFTALAATLVCGLGGLAQEQAPGLDAWRGRTVARIDLEGNRVTRDYVVMRELHTRVGEPFDEATLHADLQRLENLQIFSEVRATVQAAADGSVLLRLSVTEMPKILPLLVLSYTEENGFSFGAGLSSQNLTGRNMSLSSRAMFGGTTQVQARYAWPWISGNHRSLQVFAAHLERDDPANDFLEKSDELTPRFGRYLGKSGRLNGMFSLFHMRSDTDGKTLDPSNDDVLLRLGASVGLDTRDSWRSPRHGWQNELELWYTGFGASGDFWSANVDLRRYLPIGKRQRLSLFGLTSLQSGEVGVDVPVYFTYYVGGANSVRGHDSKAEDRPHGKNQMLGTAEYAWTVSPLRRWDFWKLSFRLGLEFAVFGDVGLAWNEGREFAMNNTRSGLGTGLRLLIPGSEMVRFDVGWSPRDGFHFHFAANTKAAAQRNRLR